MMRATLVMAAFVVEPAATDSYSPPSMKSAMTATPSKAIFAAINV
jgi:butyrate kinase